MQKNKQNVLHDNIIFTNTQWKYICWKWRHSSAIRQWPKVWAKNQTKTVL